VRHKAERFYPSGAALESSVWWEWLNAAAVG